MAVVTVIGTNGAEGEAGGPAVANAAAATDASNTATATGGDGGNAGSDPDIVNAGSGGDAQASATTTLQSAGATSATATATGGAGGGGIYNEPGGAGAPGGSATASAEDTGAANASAIASATGGAGGYGAGGGVASGVTAYASGTASALASAEQTGGNSGGGRYSASPGVSSTLTNAVSGETDNGSLTLEQTAVGGAGEYAELSSSSDGGAAISSLTFDDNTQNTTQSASITVDVSATGGAGGAGYDGGGGDATAGATITGASEVGATTSAVGGAGGSGGDGGGSGGTATATDNVTSTSGPATANASATGGSGGSTGGAAVATGDATSATGLATANATATGGDGGEYQNVYALGGSANATSAATGASVSSTAVAQGGQGGGSGLALASGAGGSGTISASASSGETTGSLDGSPTGLMVSATASGVVSGTASAEASTSIGGDSPSFVTGEQAVALVTAQPDAASIDAVASANSNIAAAFAASPTTFGVAELGGAATTTVTDAQTISDDVKISDSVFLASGDDLVLGLYDGAATGAGFSNLTLTVSVDDHVALTKSFASLAALGDYFADNAVAVSSLPSGASTLDLDVSLSMTTSTAGSSYDFGVLIGAAPEQPPTISGAVADQAITDAQTEKPFSGVTIGDVDNGTTETLTVTLSDALNGTLSNLGGGAYNAATGVYTDSGDAAALTAALDNLIFTPTAHQVAPGNTVTTRFAIGVNDGIAPTVANSTTGVVATAAEHPPTINGAVADQTIADQATDRPFSGVTIGDVDSTAQTLTLTVTLSAWANGMLSNLGGGYYDPATGVYTVSGTAAGVTAALDALTFTPTTHQVAAGSTVTTTFTIGVNDGVAPTVTNSTTSVVATATANTAAGPTVKIVGTGALAGSGGSTRTTIVGTVADNVAIKSVLLYSGGTELGAATLNGDGAWSFDASFGAGTYSDIVAVASDVDNRTSSATAPFDLITGITGSPYTSQEKTFNSAGLLVGRTYFNYDGSVYTAGTVERLPDGNVGYLYATGTAFEGQSYTSYESYFASDQDKALYEGTTTNYTGIAGQSYTGLSVSVDPYDRLMSQVFTGVRFQPFSSYEYDYVGGVYAGAQYDFTSVPNGASYSSYEADYNFANAFVGDKFFFTNVQGQSYTGEEEDFDANGHLSRVLLTGVTDQAYTSLEEEYNAGVYEGYKAFYSLTGQNYTGEEVDVSASNAITGVTYTGLTGAPYSSVQETYANGAVTSTTYDFTDQSGQDFYAYQVTKDANGDPLQETVDNDDGSHSIVGYQSNQTFTSIGDDNFTGGGANETFVFQPVYGHDTINDFVSYLTGTGHDTISLSTSEFANVPAVLNGTQNVGGSAVIAAPNGDTITLVNVSKAMLAANPGDFTFHA